MLDWLNPALHPVIVMGPGLGHPLLLNVLNASDAVRADYPLTSAAASPAASTTRASTSSSWAIPGNITS